MAALCDGLGHVVIILVLRFFERWLLKQLRKSGYNTHTVTFVGSDKELQGLFHKLVAILPWAIKFKISMVT